MQTQCNGADYSTDFIETLTKFVSAAHIFK